MKTFSKDQIEMLSKLVNSRCYYLAIIKGEKVDPKLRELAKLLQELGGRPSRTPKPL